MARSWPREEPVPHLDELCYRRVGCGVEPIRLPRDLDRRTPLKGSGRHRLAESLPVDARQVTPHEVRVDVRIGVGERNVESEPGRRLNVRGAQRDVLKE